MDPKYWVVGAMFGGTEDQLPSFLERGYWYCWDPKYNKDIPDRVRELFPQIEAGDRIAVKRLLGTGAAQIEVRALGVVKVVDQNEWRVYVDWLVTDLARRVPIKGAVSSLNGPYEPSPWVAEVFRI